MRRIDRVGAHGLARSSADAPDAAIARSDWMITSAQAWAAAAYSSGSSPKRARYASTKLARYGPMELCDAYDPTAASPA